MKALQLFLVLWVFALACAWGAHVVPGSSGLELLLGLMSGCLFLLGIIVPIAVWLDGD